MTPDRIFDAARMQAGFALGQVFTGLRELSTAYSDLALNMESHGLPYAANFFERQSRRCHAAARCIARRHPACTVILPPFATHASDCTIAGVLRSEATFERSLSSMFRDARQGADVVLESVASNLARECLERTRDLRRVQRVAARSDGELESYCRRSQMGR
jgi:hypothetical protein